MIELRHLHLDGDMPLVRALFEEYAATLGFDLCFQNFDEELASLPGSSAPPAGTIVVALVDGTAAGCVAVRPVEDGGCEMNRLYVKPAHRGRGSGRALALAVVEFAAAAGYERMRLDTLASMEEANALYRSLGFVPCERYRRNPCEHPVFMELRLR
jgi:ribosomal protein S18 acetylase RimI-like enzyme